MSKSPRKSIVASFGLLSSEIESEQNVEQEPAPSVTPARVGAGVIGAAHRAIDDIRSERDRLKALVESGGGAIKELQPSLIDPSPFPDRLPDDSSEAFEEFKRSIETQGQKVPIQVRRHPNSPERFQVVYGHRRWLAAKQLGKLVKALEVEISDIDLVVAQGIENASRQDLTWIERALFASRMDEAGIKPRDIYAALGIEDAELARMRSVYRAVPADVIQVIGRAPKIGRPRWVDLAKTVANVSSALLAIRDELAKTIPGENSDQRFQRALTVARPAASAPAKETRPLADASGRMLGSLSISSKEVRIAAEGPAGSDFLRFVEAELPSLAERFADQREH